jgi:nucleoid-associated protein YgaU
MIVAAVLFYWQSYSKDSTSIVIETESALVEQKATMPVDSVMENTYTISTVNIETEVPFVLIEELAQRSLSQIGVKDTVLYKSVGNMAVHRVGIDETLVKIAFNYYNDKRLWPYIVQHNRLRNFNQLEIGMEIEIPRLVPNR